MNFITYKEMVEDAKNFAEQLPDCDLVIGVPRSGMIAATQIAIHKGVPLASIDESGYVTILEYTAKTKFEKKYNKILLIDDSVQSGKSLNRAMYQAKDIKRNEEFFKMIIIPACLYLDPNYTIGVYGLEFYKKISTPRIFEWNWQHHIFLSQACVDIDGVVCRDPTEEENDDGEKYLEFIKNVKPKYKFTKPVKAFVTSRLEKYREETTKWLLDNGYQFEHLVMAPYTTKEERQKANKYAENKVIALEKYGSWFIESSFEQAKRIAYLSKKPVLCIDRMEMYKI